MYRIASFLLILAALGFGFTACEQDPNSTTPSANFMDQPMAAKGGGGTSSPANPAVVYLTSDNKIGVMDATSSNQTIVFAGGPYRSIASVNWSPTSSIVWAEDINIPSDIDRSTAIRTAEVVVGSNGIPTITNVRDIAGDYYLFGYRVTNPAWSSTQATDKIAYIKRDGQSHICLVASAGGSSDNIYTAPSGSSITCLTWSPDDTKIAFFQINSSGNQVLVLDVASRTIVETIATSVEVIDDLQWSRTGSVNKLAYSVNGTIYYLSPTTGATPTTNGVMRLNSNTNGVVCMSWSPDNSKLMFVNNQFHASTGATRSVSLRSNTAQTQTVSTIDNSFPATVELNWHR